MSASVRVGDATIVALSDLEQAYSPSDIYPRVGDDAWEPYRHLLTDDGKVLFNFGCYAVIADGRTLLVDTGWGPRYDGRLPDELAEAGIAPESVDAVLFTHLHGDHIGWNLEMVGGGLRPRFPRAHYLVPRGDWEYYRAREEPGTLFEEQIRPLEDLGVMDLLAGEQSLSASVTALPTPGHTPGHTSVALLSAGERAFVLGDVAITLADADATDWATSFDADPTQAIRTRRAVMERLEGEGSLVAASHFPKPGLGRLVRRGGRRVWEPV